MAKNSQNDDRLVTAPAGTVRLYKQVLAPERHDLFLSALTLVHKNKQLTKKDAETVAYLMMQTGDPTDNFHGWVRLAMWAKFNASVLTTDVLRSLTQKEHVEALYHRYTIEKLKAFHSNVQKRAKDLGWNGHRVYIVGRDRAADRSASSVKSFKVDWWKLVESRKKDVLSEFRRMTSYYEEQCIKHSTRVFPADVRSRVDIREEGWSDSCKDKQLLAALRTCYENRIDPYWVLGFYSNFYNSLPIPESIATAGRLISSVGYRYSRAVQQIGEGYGVLPSFYELTKVSTLRAFYALLLRDSPVYTNSLAVQLKAASLGVDHLYFVARDRVGLDESLSEMFGDIFKSDIQKWLEGIAGNPGVVRYFKRCLPGVVVPAAG